ncbi:MAG: hypothetical protein GC160_17850 [Acidobacteria bacterium]|nr:hypothetical protein [Acidobacteriota bacterium]
MTVNWLDLTIGGILLLSVLGAVRNGFTKEVVRLVALVFGLIAAMWGYEAVARQYLAPYIDNPQIARFTAFGGIVLGCLIVGGLVAWLLAKLWGATGLRWVDRLLGAAFGLVRGLVVTTALVLAVVAFAPVTGAEAAVAESQLAPLVLHGAKAASLVAPPALRDAYGQGFERVRSAWIAGPSAAAEPDEKPSPAAKP